MSTDVATTPDHGLPALYGALPASASTKPLGIYVIAELSSMAKSRVASPGDVVLAMDADDPAPTFLIGGPDRLESFTAYVIARDPFVASAPRGEPMEFLPKDYVRAPDERDVWNGFFFYITLQEDPLVPARMMLWRTAGMPVARSLNSFILRAGALGDTLPPHVRFTTRQRIGRQSHQPYTALSAASIARDDGVALALKHQAALNEAWSAFAPAGDADSGPVY